MELRNALSLKYGSGNAFFRNLWPDDITDEYLYALQQSGQYITNTNSNISRVEQRLYIENILTSQQSTIFGLFIDGTLVGSVGCQNLLNPDGVTLGVLIFQETNRKKGYGKLAIWCSCHMLHNSSGISSFRAGIHPSNSASLRLFYHCGFYEIERDDRKILVEAAYTQVVQPDKVRAPCLIPVDSFI